MSSKEFPDPAKSGQITFNVMKKKLAVKGWGSSNCIKKGVSFVQKTKSCRFSEKKMQPLIYCCLQFHRSRHEWNTFISDML